MNRVLLIVFIVRHFCVSGQITGFVFDINTSGPLAGTTITSDNVVTVTDSSGNFHLQVKTVPLTIIISHLGYNTKSITIHNENKIRVGLIPLSTHIDEVIISASEFKRNLKDLPASITLITKNEIEKETGSLSIGSILNKVPGLFIQSGSLNTNRIIIRGTGSRSPYSTNRIKAYFEDIPLTTGEGVTTVEDIDIESLGRIEIIRGPASELYGSGLGGVINFFADNPSFNKYFIKTSAIAGSYGSVKSSAQAGLTSRNFYITSGYNYFHSDGFRQNNKYDRSSFHTFLRFNIKKSLVKFFLYYIDLKAYIPSSIDEETYKNNPEMAATNWRQTKGFEDYKKIFSGAVISNELGKGFNNYTSFFVSTFNEYELRPFNVLEDKSTSLGSRTRFTFKHKKLNLAAGGEVFNENYSWDISETIGTGKGDLLRQNKESRAYFNIFFHSGIDVGNNSITAGMSLNKLNYNLHIQDSLNSENSKKFSPIVSPRVSFNHSFNSELLAYFLISHGFSAPSLEETLNPEGMINPDLKPESGWNAETGFRGLFLEKKLQLELLMYTMLIENLIVTKRISEEIFTGVNAGKTSHRGIEAKLNYTFNKHFLKNTGLFLSGSYTSNKFLDFMDDGNDHGGNFLPGIPDIMINTEIYRRNDMGFNFTISNQFRSSMYLNDENSAKIGGYSIFNVKTGYSFLMTNKTKFEFFASVQNVFNRKYASMILVNAVAFGTQAPRYYYPGLPLNFLAGIKVDLMK